MRDHEGGGLHFYYNAIDREVATRQRLYHAGMAVCLVCLIGTTGYWLLGEGEWGLLRCFYMVLITITTVGYGEVIPVSAGALPLTFTIFLLIGGMGVSFYFLSALTAFIVEGDLREALWRRKMNQQIEELRGHYLVCGVGEVGAHVAQELLVQGRDVVAIDVNQGHLDALTRRCGQEVPMIVGDATEDEILIDCGLSRANGVITALPTDRDNLFIVVSARQLNGGLRIVSRASNERAAEKLRRAGADAVVCPNTIGGQRMAAELTRPTVVGFLDLLTRDTEEPLQVEECLIPNGSPLDGVTLARSGIRSVSNALVLAIRSSGGKHQFNPPPSASLRRGDILVILGAPHSVRKLRYYAQGQPLPEEDEVPPGAAGTMSEGDS